MPLRFQRHSYCSKPAAQSPSVSSDQRRVEMGVGIVLLQRDRLVETRDRFAWRLSNCNARPRLFQAGVRGVAASAPVEVGDGLGRAAESQQRVAAIVQSAGWPGAGERGIEIGERLGAYARA